MFNKSIQFLFFIQCQFIIIVRLQVSVEDIESSNNIISVYISKFGVEIGNYGVNYFLFNQIEGSNIFILFVKFNIFVLVIMCYSF